VDGAKVKLQIWDTAGQVSRHLSSPLLKMNYKFKQRKTNYISFFLVQERFRSVTHAYYRDAHGTNLLKKNNKNVDKIAK
jgi:GTPase SAR1 family protein